MSEIKRAIFYDIVAAETIEEQQVTFELYEEYLVNNEVPELSDEDSLIMGWARQRAFAKLHKKNYPFNTNTDYETIRDASRWLFWRQAETAEGDDTHKELFTAMQKLDQDDQPWINLYASLEAERVHRDEVDDPIGDARELEAFFAQDVLHQSIFDIVRCDYADDTGENSIYYESPRVDGARYIIRAAHDSEGLTYWISFQQGCGAFEHYSFGSIDTDPRDDYDRPVMAIEHLASPLKIMNLACGIKKSLVADEQTRDSAT